VTTDAITKDAEILEGGAKITADVLIVADGTPGRIPDLTRVAPVFAEAEFGKTDPAATQLPTSWQEFDALMRRYSTIGVLALLAHDTGRGVEIGPTARSLLALKDALSKPDMPKSSSITIDGCGVARDVNGMLELAQGLQLNSLTAWPLLIGFAPTEISGWKEADVTQELTLRGAHILGPRKAVDAVRKRLLVYAWLQTTGVSAADFPGPGTFSPGSTQDRAAYRADQGFLSRANANTYLIPKNTLRYGGPAEIYGLRLSDAYVRLRDRQPGSATDPYQYLYQVVVQ
jgi:hypothetical protein